MKMSSLPGAKNVESSYDSLACLFDLALLPRGSLQQQGLLIKEARGMSTEAQLLGVSQERASQEAQGSRGQSRLA